MVSNRLNEIENSIQLTQEILLKSNQELARKIDLSFYANFYAALTLADSAFTMSNPENRRISAKQAINRFLEAEKHYTFYAMNAIEQNLRVAEQYLLTLSFTYIAEARCYLELEEPLVAQMRLQKGLDTLRPLFEQYINTLLTSNPAAYLHPSLSDRITLRKLTAIYQWLDPAKDEDTVFQSQRENFFKIAQSPDRWVNSLPDAVLAYVEDKSVPNIYTSLPRVMKRIEAMLETYNRIKAYQSEVKAIAQLGISFHDWLKLSPTEAKPEKAELMYIIPSAALT